MKSCIGHGVLIFCLTLTCCLQLPVYALADEGEQTPELSLSLDDVIRTVVKNNPAVRQAHLEWLASWYAAKSVWGTFEPELVLNYDVDSVDRENTVLEQLEQGGNPLFREENRSYGVNVEERLLTGGALQAGYSVNDQDNNLSVNDEYSTFVGVTLRQPLMRGAWFGSPLADVKAARKDRVIAYQNYRKQLMQVVVQAELAYWNLAFAQAQYDIAADSVVIAQDLLKDASQRLKNGKMSNLDIMEAEAELAIRDTQMLEAEDNVLNAGTQLKLLLADDQIAETHKIIVSDRLSSLVGTESSVSEVMAASLEKIFEVQPDIAIRQAELERRTIELKQRKDQILPELNVVGSYGWNGLGENYESSWDQLNDQDFISWSAGIEMRVPLFLGVQERNELGEARARKAQAQKQIEATKYEVIHSVTTLRQRIQSLFQRMVNAGQVVKFRERLLSVEMSRLDVGKSNTRLVYEVEEEFSEARYEELNSIVRYREAMLQLAYTQGTILGDKGIQVDEDAFRKKRGFENKKALVAHINGGQAAALPVQPQEIPRSGRIRQAKPQDFLSPAGPTATQYGGNKGVIFGR